MYKKIIIFILCFILYVAAWCQTTENIMTVDQRTFNLWQQQNWKQLLKEGKAALDKGFDFYYLRVRMGVASYEQKNFHRAITHFEKAIIINNQEEYLSKYLYYSYVFGGRPEEAQKLASTFNKSLKEKTGTYRKPLISEIRLFYNMDVSSSKATASNYSIDIDTTKIGEQFIANNHHFIHLGLSHNISPGFSIDHGYSFVNQHYFLFKQTDSLRESDPNYVSNVHQYYILGNIRLAKNWHLGLGLHYIGVRYSLKETFFGRGGRRQVSSKKTDSDISLFVQVKKNFPYVSAGGAFYYSTLNNADQIQTDVVIQTYPLGNLDLYTNTVFSWQQEKISGHSNQRIILQQEIGGKIFKHLWIEGFGILGNVHDFMTANGQVVYNNANTMKLKIGARLIIPINNKIQFIAAYGYSVNESAYKPEEPDDILYNKTIIYNHSITGGLTWNLSKPAKY